MRHRILAALCLLPVAALAQRYAAPIPGIDIISPATWVHVGLGVSASRPATCVQGQVYICVGAGCTNGNNIHFCRTTDTWEPQGVAAGSGITTLGAQVGATQTFSKVDDTNVALTITSATNNHEFAMSWVGALAKARQHAATVYNDAANTWSTGAQDMGAATSFKVPTSAGAAPTASGLLGYDSTANNLTFGQNAVNRIIEHLGNKNAASGYAGLTASTKINIAQGQEVWGLTDLSDVASKRGNSTQVQMTTGAALTDECAKFDANGNIVSFGAGCATGSAHAVLSATHTDSTVGTVVRGDLITGQTATPKWTRLALGANGFALKSDGTDIIWGADNDTGITSWNGSTALTQTATPKTTGTDFAIVLVGADHEFRIPNTSASARGLVPAAMFTQFNNARTRPIGITIDGGGSAITTGNKGCVQVDYAATIQQVTMLADQSGSIVVDIWKDSYALYPATVADTITAAAKPTITTATKSQDATLTGWTTTITAGDHLCFNVDSATTITRVHLSLKVQMN